MTTAFPIESGFVGQFISAPWRSSGKSMVSMGLARAATRRSLGVQTFKKGPDFIDPLWLKAASFNPCYNLDPYLQNTRELQQVYLDHPNDVVLVEGTMGLHDGLAVDGSDCNAAVAKQLNLPVLLVIDCGGMHRTLASLVNGITQFDQEVEFSGLILNRIRSQRHAGKVERAIAEYCDVNVVGCIAEQATLQLDERELGLLPAPAHPQANAYIDAVANAIEASVDLDSVFKPNRLKQDQSLISASVKTQINPYIGTSSNTPIKDKNGALNSLRANAVSDALIRSRTDHSACGLSIGIAKDEAFHFYYEDDLDTIRARGVRLIEFSPLRDSLPEHLDGLLIGGGFPERHAAQLSGNRLCRNALAEAITSGLPVRAECGGLMYLCESIIVDHDDWDMVGALPGVATMQPTPQGRGYMKLKHNSYSNIPSHMSTHPGSDTGSDSAVRYLSAHEFHHSSITFDEPPEFAFEVERGFGIDGQHDGVCVNNVVASYAHFRHTEATPWIDWFLTSVQRVKKTSHKQTQCV